MTRVAALALLITAVPRATAAPGELPPSDPPLAERPRLELSLPATAAVAGGALAAWLTVTAVERNNELTSCRWCEPNGFDLRARSALRWQDTRAAGDASDVLLLAVPLASAAAVASLAARDGRRREIVEDVAIVALAIAVNAPVTEGVKYATARLRPEPWATGGPRSEADLHSFFSGHVSRVAAATTSATQVARLRGRRGWKWLAAGAIATTAATAWLRVAADQHWATDVLGGAASGVAVGLAVPPLVLRPRGNASAIAWVAPAPGGIAIRF